jgi:hypothetical protein
MMIRRGRLSASAEVQGATTRSCGSHSNRAR